tara:strand:+ start:1973 stop:2182 length:210 start_codon:yes stop_codon:yes gene_type:complete
MKIEPFKPLSPRIAPVPGGVFATPKDMKALEDYLALFHGSEAIVANTCAWMAWNLACKIVNESEEEEES